MAQISPVLIVDDDGPSCELVATLLERVGVASRTAASAEEAVSIFEGEAVSLAILDIDLRDERSGYHLFRSSVRVRRSYP